jgi:type II secretory pathway component PulF
MSNRGGEEAPPGLPRGEGRTEAEVEDRAKNLSTVLEPMLLIFVGLVVGFIAISIITPIYQVTQHIKPK